MEITKLKWYVLHHEFNSDIVEPFNIFRSSRFCEGVEELLKKYTTFENFKEKLNDQLRYAFWSKAEYEIICSGLVSKYDKEYKIDVYSQVAPNLDILANYIIDEYNKHKRKKLEK